MITDDLFEAFIYCQLKAHLRQTGASGDPSEFVAWQRENLHSYREKCQLVLRATVPESECLPITSTLTDLSRSHARLFFNCQVECDQFQTTIDAVERLRATNKQEGSFLVPIRFVPQNKVTKHDRLCLAFSAYVLSKATGTQCTLGKIIHGDGQATLRVKMTDDADTVRSIIARLAEQQTTAEPPPLILNRHCPECEFRQRCRAPAVEKDELTLLSGMTEAERKKQHSKGIFTVTQLSYTFRPRRRPKGQVSRADKHDHALRALAIRQAKIHVAGKPELNLTGTPVFLDVEGLPDRDFYYLIGLRVESGGSFAQHSFWADGVLNERDIWASFLSMLSAIGMPQIVHYGDYERTFLNKMKERYAESEYDHHLVNGLITGSVNVLSVIYAKIYFPIYTNGLKDVAGSLRYSQKVGK